MVGGLVSEGVVWKGEIWSWCLLMFFFLDGREGLNFKKVWVEHSALFAAAAFRGAVWGRSVHVQVHTLKLAVAIPYRSI